MTRASPWPAADQIFRRTAWWCGADAAYSVALSDHSTLWLFGDTFVGPSRQDSRLVHNSIGIQQGPDPTSAELTLHVGGTAEEPTPFFPAEPGTWLWPMAGARTPAGVVVFFMQVRSARPDLPTVLDAWRAEGSLRFFEVFDWKAALITNPDEPISRWDVQMLATPPAVDRVMPGAGAICVGDYLYAYGWRDGHELRPGLLRRRPRYHGYWRPRLGYLLRWRVERDSGLQEPQWWCGSGWDANPGAAVSVIESPATEFTVHEDDERGGFVLVEAAPWLLGVDRLRVLGALQVLKRFPSTNRALSWLRLLRGSVSVRRAPALTGPWSRPTRVFTPRVAKDVLVYAGKAHPQLSGQGDLVCTYAQISFKADRTLADDSLYYPRFIRVRPPS
jgi:hypothetical protein